MAPVPCEGQLLGPRNMGHYQGLVSNITGLPGRLFCDPTDDFVEEDLLFRPSWNMGGETGAFGRCQLYNGRLGDGHLSPRGAAVWANCVAKRLALLLRKEPANSDETGSTSAFSAGTRRSRPPRHSGARTPVPGGFSARSVALARAVRQ